jgi:hypothetical protein
VFRIRTPRFGIVSAAVTVALAGAALTACSDSSGARDEGTAKAGATITYPSTTAPTAAPSASSAGQQKPGSQKSGAQDESQNADSDQADSQKAEAKKADKPGSAKAPAAGGTSVTCTASDTKVSAAPLSRPVNHMLLTVTNTGKTTCYLYGYPALQFSDAQSVPPVVESSHPQAVTTLSPGQSGYASVQLSAGDGSGTNGRTVKSLTVYFSGRSGSGSVGAGAHPSLPAQGVHIDDSLRTTYWEQSMQDALTW